MPTLKPAPAKATIAIATETHKVVIPDVAVTYELQTRRVNRSTGQEVPFGVYDVGWITEQRHVITTEWKEAD